MGNNDNKDIVVDKRTSFDDDDDDDEDNNYKYNTSDDCEEFLDNDNKLCKDDELFESNVEHLLNL